MLFWLFAAFLTLIAALAVLWPWLRQPSSPQAEAAGDLAVYRDQLAELDRDVARGAIAAETATEARAEIARRVLKASAKAGEPVRSARNLRLAGVAAVLAVPLIGWSFYATLGAPGLPAQPLAERMTRNPANNSVEELVARAESHLKANPDDASGWEVIAPIYMRIGRVDDAIKAYETLIRLAGQSADREAALGEALLTRDNGVIGPDSRAAFDRALTLDSKHAKARFFVALAHAQAGKLGEAKAQWTSLIADVDPASPWVGASREALAQVDQIAGGSAPAPVDKGPTQEEVAAANDMSAGDRAAMIDSMVARLDASLKEKPGDLDGWKKLVRAYLVMGKPDAAKDAIVRAEKGLEPGRFAELKTFARDAGMTGLE